jgi:hypothetical protein
MFDSCFSGSVLDLKYQYMDSLNYDNYTENNKELEKEFKTLTQLKIEIGSLITQENHQKIAEICKCIVKIAQILNHNPKDNMSDILMYNTENVHPSKTPLYIYLMTKPEYVKDELILIVKYTNLINFKFNSEYSKNLLLKYIIRDNNINSSYDTIKYLLDCYFTIYEVMTHEVMKNSYYSYIIKILDTILKIRVKRVKNDVIQNVIQIIRDDCVSFRKIEYDFFTPYLSDNTNVEVDILNLLRTDYVTSLKWKSPESSPVHIYLKNNYGKPYMEEVIHTLRKHLNPSCITSIAKEWYQDPQLSALFNELIKPDDTQKQEQASAAAAAPPTEILAGGRKYRTKSMKKYKFSYQ